jgi:GMP synthase-like glutamine amidotransferase
MRFLVFQHIACEHPAIFRDFLKTDGIAWDAVELDEGEPVPDFAGYDALMVMGGPMDVWQEAEHPWLVTEKQAIRRWVEAGKPYLGLCLGHQLLAASLGGEVGPGQKEVGVLDVELTPAGVADPLFAGLPRRFPALQWHGAEVKRAPQGAAVLAASPLCAVQALRVGERAWGMQFHVECTAATVPEWGEIPVYACALEETLGAGALEGLRSAAAAAMPGFNQAARQIYRNFIAALRNQPLPRERSSEARG